MKKTFYPGKIMYSAVNANVIVVQLLRQEGDVFYVRGLFNGSWSDEYMQYGFSHYHNTREEAFCQALEQLSASVKALPSIDELRDIEMNATNSRYDLSNVFE